MSRMLQDQMERERRERLRDVERLEEEAKRVSINEDHRRVADEQLREIAAARGHRS